MRPRIAFFMAAAAVIAGGLAGCGQAQAGSARGSHEWRAPSGHVARKSQPVVREIHLPGKFRADNSLLISRQN